jgi:hypothetical protein
VSSKAKEGEVVAIGRPPKLTKLERARVFQALVDYIDRTPDPTIVGFVSWDPTPIELNVTDDNINDWEEFSRLRKRAVKKQEAYLLMGATTGKLNPTMAIFRLKQPVHGYKDRVDTDITSDGKGIQPLLVSFINNKTDVLPDGTDTNTD